MKRFLIPPIALIGLIVILLVACGSAEFSSDESVLTQNMSDEKFADSRARGASGPSGEAGVFTSRSKAVAPEPSFGGPAAIMAIPEPAPLAPPSGDGAASASSQLQVAQRKVISSASITVEVDNVQPAINEIRSISEGLGGFVEQLSSSGNAAQQQARMTVRVPQDQFFTTLERIEALGEVQSQDLGSEDVSERFIDLEARLKSSVREEESLLKLLERSSQVSEILTVERELSRVRTEIEKLQGQLNFLDRRVDLATINVSLYPPGKTVPQPPSLTMTIETTGVTERTEEVKNLVASLNGEIDRVFISIREGRERANISLRVFPENFAQAAGSLESMGEIRSKELQEGAAMDDAETKRPKEPNARIELSLVEDDSSNTGLIIGIVASVGGIILLGLLGVGILFIYRASQRSRVRYGI